MFHFVEKWLAHRFHLHLDAHVAVNTPFVLYLTDKESVFEEPAFNAFFQDTSFLEIQNDEAYLARVVKMGAEKARESASKTLREVREIMGFKPF